MFPSGSLLQPDPSAPRKKAPEKPTEPEVIATANPALTTRLKIRTPQNAFGLYKVFPVNGSGDKPHDPDNCILPEDLREQQATGLEEAPKSPAELQSKFYPFPNLSSYRIGEWFWSDDTEKSQRSFQDLVEIVGSEDFNPADIRAAKWSHIDKALASSHYDADDLDSKQWVDDGISWKSIPINLTVLFSKYTEHPGNHAFTVEGFHYRPLTPIIREKLESSAGREYFHTLGHELRWNPGVGKERVRVHGEMYNSPAFLQAYTELQVSQGC